MGVKQEYLDLITNKDLDYDIEGDPTGPEVDEATNLVHFHNGTTKLCMTGYTFSVDRSTEILDLLQLIELRVE